VRAIAAILVVLTHSGFLGGAYWNGQVGAFLARCDVGVALFFALSGFLLSRPWLRVPSGTVKIRRYFKHRFYRIVPAYYLALIAVVVTLEQRPSSSAIISNFTFTQVYTGSLLDHFTQTWSLCAEVGFYLVLPFLAPWALARNSRNPTRSCLRRCLSLAAIGWAWIIVFNIGGANVTSAGAGQWMPGHLDWFAVGIFIAATEKHIRLPVGQIAAQSLLRRPGTLMAIAFALFWISMTPLAGPRDLATPFFGASLVKEILYAAIGGLVVTAALTRAAVPTWWGRMLASRFMRWGAEISFAVFLWHLLVLSWVRSTLGLPEFAGGWLIPAILTLIGSAVVGQLSLMFVERPFMRLARR